MSTVRTYDERQFASTSSDLDALNWFGKRKSGSNPEYVRIDLLSLWEDGLFTEARKSFLMRVLARCRMMWKSPTYVHSGSMPGEGPRTEAGEERWQIGEGGEGRVWRPVLQELPICPWQFRLKAT